MIKEIEQSRTEVSLILSEFKMQRETVLRFNQGEVKSYLQLNKNIVSRSTIKLPLLILSIFSYPPALCLMVLILLSVFVAKATPINPNLFIIELVIFFSFTLLKELFLRHLKMKTQKKINEQKPMFQSKVYRRKKQIRVENWGQIQSGDIILLCEGDVAPADLLVLDCQAINQNESVIYVKSSQVHCEKKKPCERTKTSGNSPLKMNWNSYKQHLDGILRFQMPNSNLFSFEGQLKLTNDPKVEKLTINNLVLRESLIKTGWMFGLVIYAGMDCKIFKQKELLSQRIRQKSKMKNIYFIFMSLGLIIFVICSSLHYGIKDIYPSFSFYFTLIHHLIQCSVWFPNLMYISQSIFQLYFSLKRQNQISIMDYSNFSAFNSIDIAVIFNKSVLHSATFSIKQIITASSVYQISQKTKPVSNNTTFDYNNLQKNKAIKNQFIIDDQIEGFVNIINKRTQKLKPILQPLRITNKNFMSYVQNEETDTIQLLKTFCLCNQTHFMETSNGEFTFNSFARQEQLGLNIIKSVGWNIRVFRIDNVEVGLQLKMGNAQWKRYRRKINTFSVDRALFSVAIDSQGQYKLYCKGRSNSMLDRLKDKNKAQQLINNMTKREHNEDIIIYGQKIMNDEQYEQFQKDLLSLKNSLNLDQGDALKKFSNKYENDLQLVCIVNLCSQPNENSVELLSFFKQKNIKTCIVAENINEVEGIKKLVNQSSNSIDFVELNMALKDEIKYRLNGIVLRLKGDENFSYSIILKGDVWVFLNTEKDLLKLFLFVAYYAKVLLIYTIDSASIAILANTLRTAYPQEQKIISIGSSFESLLIQSSSHISIAYSNQNQSCFQYFTDVTIRNLCSIQSLFSLGNWFSNTLDELKMATFYRTITIGIVVVSLQLTAFWNSLSFNLPSILIYLYTMQFGLMEIFFIIINNKKGAINEKQNKSCFIKTLIEAIIHGLTISVSILLIVPNIRFDGGKILPIQTIYFCLFFLLFVTGIGRHFFRTNYLSFIIMLFANTSTMTACFILVFLFNSSFIKIISQFSLIFTSYNLTITLINSILFCLAISMFLIEVAMRSNAFETLPFKKQTKPELVKHLFNKTQSLEQSIQELVQGIDLTGCRINNILQIINQQHRMKERYLVFPKNIPRYLLTMGCIAAFTIGTFIINILIEINAIIITLSTLTLCLIVIFSFYIYSNLISIQLNYYPIAQVSLILVSLLIFISCIINNDQTQLITICCFLCACMTQIINIRFMVVLVWVGSSLLAVVILLIHDFQINKLSGQFATCIISMVVCCLCHLWSLKRTTVDSRISFLIKEQNEAKTQEVNAILNILVPPFVKQHFLEGKGSASKEKSVAILFCYVCNFQSVVREEGVKIVTLIDKLWREFDKLCMSNFVQKIETVGYTYMAATGIRLIENELTRDKFSQNKVERLMNMAVQMLEITNTFRWGSSRSNPLEIKVGIHCGQTMIGVIGKEKMQFSLIGTTVNITSRHCSTGVNGSITLSVAAHRELTQDCCKYTFTTSSKKMKGLTDQAEQVPIFRYQKTIQKKQALTSKNLFKELVLKLIKKKRRQKKNNFHTEKTITETNLFFSNKQLPCERNFNRKRTTSPILQKNFLQIIKLQNSRDRLLDNYNIFLELRQQKKKLNEDKKTNVIQAQSIFLSEDKIVICVLLVINVLVFTLQFLQVRVLYQIICRSGSFLALIITLVYITYAKSGSKRDAILIVCLCYIVISEKIIMFLSSKDIFKTDFSVVLFMVYFTGYSLLQKMRFLYSLIISGILLICFIVLSILQQNLRVSNVCQVLYLVCGLLHKYHRQRENIINTVQCLKLQQMRREQAKVVSQLLPKHAYEKLKKQEHKVQLTDQFDECTILYADITGFTKLSNSKENKNNPENVVEILRELFERFDQNCIKRNVYKVYTIGDCYVVLGLMNCYERDPVKEANNVIQMGFDMIESIGLVQKKLHSDGLNMRIGIHTGSIIGGIIGTEVVRYDIYGPDVMIANKFQEQGLKGVVHISQTTKKLIEQRSQHNYQIKPYQQVSIQKLNVTLNGYLVTKSKFTDQQN